MVSKITLFEPHFDGAQIGPASIGTDEPTDLGSDELESESDSTEIEPSTSSRLPSARLFVGVASLAAGMVAGVLAWRRFRSGSTAATDESADSEDEPMIEKRPVEDLTQE